MQYYFDKLAVIYENQGDRLIFQQLAERLAVPLYDSVNAIGKENFLLSWRAGELQLLDRELITKCGLTVSVEPRNGEQRSWPAPKQGVLAQAIGRKTTTVVDATAGWGQDGLAIFRMGYEVLFIERSPVMAELLMDGFNRLANQNWIQKRQIQVPQLLTGNAIDLLSTLPEQPDCIYLDPMFPPKRKKSALAKKSMQVLRELLGDDFDKEQLFEAAIKSAKKRVVVKSPDDAPPLGGKPDVSFQGKLLRYDIYLVS